MKVFNPVSQCHSKTRYFSQREAADNAKFAAQYGKGKMKPYRYPHCSTDEQPRWHIGHKPIKRRGRDET